MQFLEIITKNPNQSLYTSEKYPRTQILRISQLSRGRASTESARIKNANN